MAEQGGNRVVLLQQLTSRHGRRLRVIGAGGRIFLTPDQAALRHRAAKTEQALLADTAPVAPANVGDVAVSALDKITRGQVRRLAVIAHHQVAFLFQQRLRNRHKRQRAVTNVFRKRGGAGVRRQVDDARHALLLK